MLLTTFRTHLHKNFPELLQGHFLVACSGGMDSVVLVWLCHYLQLSFSIAHCHFGLRGKESDADADFVGNLGDSINKKVYVKCFETKTYAIKNKVSIQVAARRLRYAWFEQLLKAHNLSFCLTAHHADDNLETFLINLSRGTGLKGLTGIPEKTDGLARPLLVFTREMLAAFAVEKKLQWREDRSNLDKKYLRNQIRLELVPALKKTHPVFMDNFRHTQVYLQDSYAILQKHLEMVRSSCFLQDGDTIKIRLKELEKLSPLQAYLHGLLSDYGFTEWDNVAGLLTAIPGKQVFSESHRLVRARGYLLLEQRFPGVDQSFYFDLEPKTIREPLYLKIESVSEMDQQSRKILYIDKETLKEGITIRKWKKGDYFYPFGMKGKRKLLSKFFKDEKMDLIAKENQWLLCTHDAIIWIIGRRSDNRFRVTGDTRDILKITLEE